VAGQGVVCDECDCNKGGRRRRRKVYSEEEEED